MCVVMQPAWRGLADCIIMPASYAFEREEFRVGRSSVKAPAPGGVNFSTCILKRVKETRSSTYRGSFGRQYILAPKLTRFSGMDEGFFSLQEGIKSHPDKCKTGVFWRFWGGKSSPFFTVEVECIPTGAVRGSARRFDCLTKTLTAISKPQYFSVLTRTRQYVDPHPA